ncbi:hypothetical protein N7G274_004409 [Stereocaulon virgatum]|uniref:Uncharacterized protein n=1 Tax=Stereocaulon virgatum TaxID=373712 RepID=A0ABR4AA48_9LECA
MIATYRRIMPLHNGNLHNWFKPFTVPEEPQKKRPLSEDTYDQRAVKRLPLSSPKENQRPHEGHEDVLQTGNTTIAASPTTQASSSSQKLGPANSQDAEPDKEPPVSAAEDAISGEESYIVTAALIQDDAKSRDLTFSSSQSVLTNSQRMMKNGEVMIRNSDDESCSDSSLEDMDHLLRRKSSREASLAPDLRLSDMSSEKKSVDGKIVQKLRDLPRKRKPAFPPPSTLPVMPRAYKYSLESLARQRKQHEVSDEVLARASSTLQSYDERKADKSQSLENEGTSGGDLVNKLMKDQGDDDDASRLRTAIQRTEALQQGKSWSFFDKQPSAPLIERKDFPALAEERLQPLLAKTTLRQQTFVSGYVGEYAMKASLPEDILLWIMDEICLEPRDDLRYSYTNTLRSASDQLSKLLDPERIATLFRNLGATAEALNSEQPVSPRPVLSENLEHASPPGLIAMLDLFGSVASDLAIDCRNRLLSILCRLALDHSVIKDCHAIGAIGHLFSDLIDSIRDEDPDHELQTVLTTVFHSVHDASLRLQLLQMIPPLHRGLVVFRQRLALAFFFQNSRYLSKPPEDLVDLKSIADRLRSPQFTINNATDYAEFAASIGILSIGIDCGNPPRQGSTRDVEVAFNSDVDILASKIRAMFTQIIDTSASQMKRTEAKEILEGFHSRLKFAIRTRPPAKKTPFGNSNVKPLQERIEAFVVRGKQDDAPTVPNGV